MRTRQGLILIVLLLTVSLGVHGQEQSSAPVTLRLLKNSDIVRMVEDGTKSGDIIFKILTSSCNFDVFPPVLRDLKRRGVPDTVLVAMKMAPNGPPALRDNEPVKALPITQVNIPAGTAIEIETAHATSSKDVSPGDPITFLVTRRVYVNNLLVIERGAVARARVVKRRAAGAWGRAGMLAWELEYVTAVDGTRIPIALTGKQNGTNRLAALAGGAVATGALIFPYTSPVALIWGLKKGDEAVLRGSRVFMANVRSATEVAGLQPRPGGVVYRDRDTVKASAAPPTNTNFERGSFKPGGGFRPNNH